MRAFVAEMFSRLAKRNRLQVTSFVVDASPTRARAATFYLDRSFRYELNGCASLVTVRGARETSRAAELCKNVKSAGYELWVDSPDHAIFRRWLTDSRRRAQELEFLQSLGSSGQGTIWPTRSPTAHPTRHRPRAWSRVVQQTCESGVPWTACTVGLSRELSHAQDDRFAVVVSALGTCRRAGKPTVDIFVSIFSKSEPNHPLPSHLAACAARRLQLSGYQTLPMHRGSKREGRAVTVRVTKRVGTPAAAERECINLISKFRSFGRERASGFVIPPSRGA
jgi:hypothetical protein